MGGLLQKADAEEDTQRDAELSKRHDIADIGNMAHGNQHKAIGDKNREARENGVALAFPQGFGKNRAPIAPGENKET